MRSTPAHGRHTPARGIALLLTTLALSACSAPPSSLPGALEAHHHLRFQNGYVRVMETRLEPGQETLLHSHPIESAVVFLTDGQFRISQDDGSAKEESVEAGTVAFGDSAIVHRTANIGDETARVVTVEIFSLQPPNTQAALPAEGETLLENAKARMARLHAAPRQSVWFQSPTPTVIVAETAGVVTTSEGAMTLKPGDARWCEPGRIELGAGPESPFRAIVVLLKPRD